MDLASLQVFQTVARERSFSRAAEALPHPAGHQHLHPQARGVGGAAAFRAGLRCAHADRCRQLLLEYADRMLNLREEIHKGVRELRGLERGRLDRRERKLDPPRCCPRSIAFAVSIRRFRFACSAFSHATCPAKC